MSINEFSAESQRRVRKLANLQDSPAYPTLDPPSSYSHLGSSAQVGGSLQGSWVLVKRNDAQSWTWSKRRMPVTIDILPDDVLLDIFDILAVESNESEAESWWRTLVHVCRRWRIVIFESPRRLNLRLVCSDRTPLREMLDVWPLLPIIVIRNFAHPWSCGGSIIAALEHNDRVCQIKLKLDLRWKKLLDAMQEPFPALTHLALSSDMGEPLIVPASFLGRSAPCLQYLRLQHIPIRGLPELLLSATGLVQLILLRIPRSGYVSPKTIVTFLSALPKLEKLSLRFDSFELPRSPANGESRCLPPPTRSLFPALIKLHFNGVREYLEDLVARIDSPLLNCLEISLFHLRNFDAPQLVQFISRTPTLKVHHQARIDFSDLDVRVSFPKSVASTSLFPLTLAIVGRQPEWQLSSIAQVCTSFFPRSFICKVQRLMIRERSHSKLEWRGDIKDRKWLELLHPFTGVKTLYLSKEIAPRIAPYLQELVAGRTTEVLPVLQNLSLEDHPPAPFEEAIGKFVAARQLSNLPVAIFSGGRYLDENSKR